MNRLKSILALTFLMSTQWLEAACDYAFERAHPHQLYIGPEVSYLHREKEGGVKQNGFIYGGRLGYDYIKRYCFYFGGEAAYTTGKIHGKADCSRLSSWFTDASVEGRIGYTFQQKCGWRFAFTPFVGGGYQNETNDFVSPSPLRLHFRIHYPYVCGGFLSQISLCERWDVGLNFKVKYPIDPRCTVSHDEEFGGSKMVIEERFQYRVELPLTYHLCDLWYLRLVPFYELREYGRQANFPFDFQETSLDIYGLTLKFLYRI